MKVPKIIKLTEDQIDELLLRVENNALQPGDYEIIKGVLDTVKFLAQAYEEKAVSNNRLLRMIFGHRTDKTKNILGTDDGSNRHHYPDFYQSQGIHPGYRAYLHE